MIDWNSFKNPMRSYFRSLSASNTEDVAEIISSYYDSTVRRGGELVANNFVTKGNRELLKSQIQYTLIRGLSVKQGIYNSLLEISRGFVSYWTGAQLSTVSPPPGAIAVVSNIVTNPGIEQGIPTSFVNDYDSWLDLFISVAEIHLSTMQGQMVALYPTPTGPVPITIPWIGYK